MLHVGDRDAQQDREEHRDAKRGERQPEVHERPHPAERDGELNERILDGDRLVAAAAAGGAAAAEAVAEQTEFTVVLTQAGSQKIQVIKELRGVTALGLKEAKDLVDGAPKTVKEGVSKEEAASIKAKLEAAGATIEIK